MSLAQSGDPHPDFGFTVVIFVEDEVMFVVVAVVAVVVVVGLVVVDVVVVGVVVLAVVVVVDVVILWLCSISVS